MKRATKQQLTDSLLLDRDARQIGKSFREGLGVFVILGHTIDVVLERVHARSGDHAGLAHRAAHALLPGPSLGDELASTGEHRPDRTICSRSLYPFR